MTMFGPENPENEQIMFWAAIDALVQAINDGVLQKGHTPSALRFSWGFSFGWGAAEDGRDASAALLRMPPTCGVDEARGIRAGVASYRRWEQAEGMQS